MTLAIALLISFLAMGVTSIWLCFIPTSAIIFCLLILSCFGFIAVFGYILWLGRNVTCG